jgi:hypothetical protein
VFPLEYWLDVRWYISLSLSVIGYLLMRYIGLGINERRRLKREMERRDVVDRKTDPV